MNTRLLLVFGIGVVAAILVFAASPIIATHQAYAREIYNEIEIAT
jgi:hypothetical protein